ncbi:sensor histidine kinase [Frondihabitans peucedani]|uniref:histidine kinase n=1 Tax=Frondihabitans peucedani TaxID=598626 RepID=A0ABP8E490_9MICO
MTIDWARLFSSRVFRVDLVTGLIIAVLGLVPGWIDLTRPHLITVLLAIVATALRRSMPGTALAATWILAVFELWLGERPSLIALTYVLVLYAVARVGNRWQIYAGGVSVVFGGVIASVYLYRTGARFTEFAYGSYAQTIIVLLAPPAVLGLAWLIGLTVRFFFSRNDESELRLVAESEAHRALDVAAEERARASMARDVHDIVGHSLAVIIAQADSVEFLDDTDRIRAVNATIADTARRSLREVREVLSGTSTPVADDAPQDLTALVEQVRAAGVVIEHRLRGERRVLDPARSVVVRRVAQEMLTNALRHGAPGEPVLFAESWRSGDVVLEVENAVVGRVAEGGGLGVEGMRARVTAVGGFLEAEGLEGVFTARARIPVPATADPAEPGQAVTTTPKEDA